MITLRCATYLTPSIPVEYFEMILHYLESEIRCHTTLLYESRWEGPSPEREDPFLTGYLDLAFMTSSAFLKLTHKGSPCELLNVSPLHQHPRGNSHAGVFADIIMHKDLSKKVKDFIDLRGCKWSCNNPDSLTTLVTLSNLKELGENATFFGNILYSGSYLESVKMVIGKKVDAAVVDANCLAMFLDRYPHLADEIEVLTSWGPLSPYPIVVNCRLDDHVKEDIVDCLLNMHKCEELKKKLEEFHIEKFVPIKKEDFEKELSIKNRSKGLSLGTTYY